MEVSGSLVLGITHILSHQLNICLNTVITLSEGKGRMGIKCGHKALIYSVKNMGFWQYKKILTLDCH